MQDPLVLVLAAIPATEMLSHCDTTTIFRAVESRWRCLLDGSSRTGARQCQCLITDMEI